MKSEESKSIQIMNQGIIDKKVREVFSRRLSQLMTDRRIKKSELAIRLGCQEGRLTKMLNGTTLPRLGFCYALCKILRVRLDYLIGLVEADG